MRGTSLIFPRARQPLDPQPAAVDVLDLLAAVPAAHPVEETAALSTELRGRAAIVPEPEHAPLEPLRVFGLHAALEPNVEGSGARYDLWRCTEGVNRADGFEQSPRCTIAPAACGVLGFLAQLSPGCMRPDS